MSIEYILEMLFYIVLIVLCLLVFRLYKNTNKAVFIFLSITAVFSAIRFDVGWDYFNYIDIIINEVGHNGKRDMEFMQLNFALMSLFFGSTQLFFVVNAFLISLFIFLGIRSLSQDKEISALVYLCMPLFYLTSLSIVRFALAFAIVFYAITLLLKGKLIPFILFTLLAFLSHNSALIILIALPFYYIKVDRKFNILIFSIIALLSSASFFSSLIESYLLPVVGLVSGDIGGQLQHYMNTANSIGGNKIPIIFYTINIINFIFYKKLVKRIPENKDTEINKFLITIFNMGCCIMLIFSIDTSLSGRLGSLFLSVLMFIVPLYCNSGIIDKKSIKIIVYVVLSFIFIYQLSLSNYNGNDPMRKSTYIPYQTYFNK